VITLKSMMEKNLKAFELTLLILPLVFLQEKSAELLSSFSQQNQQRC